LAATLRNILSQAFYSGEREIFVTNLFDVNRVSLGEQMVSQLKSTQGHIVIRVKPGGESYQVYILDDSSESFTITASS
jgi:arginine repressor